MLIKKSPFQRQHPLLISKVKKNVLWGTCLWFGATLFFPFLGLGYAFYDFSPQSWIMVGLIWAFYIFIILCIVMYHLAHYKTYYYDLTDKYLIIAKGVFQRQETTVPYERIQDVYIDQDFLDRFFHLYDVHISTATNSSYNRAHIDGVSLASAEKIREMILKKVADTSPQ